ncbi:MAG: biotin/lipoyl-binding protein, partial [Gammaproteobacteria bacterium]|nr:biotin/lipoyl-binding protein [Gammaproteobacteria bacterium]
MRLWVPILVLVAAAGAAAWLGQDRLFGAAGERPSGRGGKVHAVPVEVAAVGRGPIERKRAFTGTLEARAEFVVAPKVGGRIEEIAVDLADTVNRGQLVARLDDDEFVQTVAQVEAG